MDQKSDLIKEDIDQTRNSLTEKLGVLEDQLRAKVEVAKEQVRQFSPSHQVQQHPLVALGGTVAIGFVLGRSLKVRRACGISRKWVQPSHAVEDLGTEVPQTSEYEESWSGASAMDHSQEPRMSYPKRREPGLLTKMADRVKHQFPDELQMVKGMALGALINTARGLAKQAVPTLRSQIDRVLDSAMETVGAEPMPQVGYSPIQVKKRPLKCRV